MRCSRREFVSLSCEQSASAGLGLHVVGQRVLSLLCILQWLLYSRILFEKIGDPCRDQAFFVLVASATVATTFSTASDTAEAASSIRGRLTPKPPVDPNPPAPRTVSSSTYLVSSFLEAAGAMLAIIQDVCLMIGIE